MLETLKKSLVEVKEIEDEKYLKVRKVVEQLEQIGVIGILGYANSIQFGDVEKMEKATGKTAEIRERTDHDFTHEAVIEVDGIEFIKLFYKEEIEEYKNSHKRSVECEE